MSKNGIIKFVITICFLAVFITVISVIGSSLRQSKTNQGDKDYNIRLNNKYDVFSYIALHANSELGNDIKVIFPEGEGFDKVKISPLGLSLDYVFKDYRVAVGKILDGDSFLSSRFHEYDVEYDFYKKSGKNVEDVEIDGVRYLIIGNKEIYFIEDGYGILISSFEHSSPLDIEATLEHFEFVHYEFVDYELARGVVYDDSRVRSITFNGKDLTVEYKYTEINHFLGLEYDVYTDGLNEFMIDKDEKIIGYTLNEQIEEGNSDKKSIDIAKDLLNSYANKNFFRLENQTKDSYLFAQYINDYKTTGFARVKFDEKNNVVAFLVKNSEIDDSFIMPKIDDKVLNEKIKQHIDQLFGLVHKVNTFEIRDLRYTLDEESNLIAVCTLDVDIYKVEPYESDNVSLTVRIKV